jgi:predicted metal-binding membrane protein
MEKEHTVTETLSATPMGALPRRDKIAILTGLIGVTTLAWVYLVVMAVNMSADMGAMDMGMIPGGGTELNSEMSSSMSMEPAMPMGESMGEAGTGPMGGMAMMEMPEWTPVYFLLMFLMWAVMMVGMMVPTAIPMTLIYAQVAKKASSQGTTLAPAAVFVTGYIVMWTAFSLIATMAQWGLDEAALLSPMMVSTSPALGGGLLIAAGLYQLTPYKKACLQHCRAPAHFISKHWRSGRGGAFKMGLHHGAFCLGCCWVLMGLLFFGGVMSLWWIAGITLFVLLEKVIPHGILGGRLAGVLMMGTGLGVVALWVT